MSLNFGEMHTGRFWKPGGDDVLPGMGSAESGDVLPV